jgi:hypothetical protein
MALSGETEQAPTFDDSDRMDCFKTAKSIRC